MTRVVTLKTAEGILNLSEGCQIVFMMTAKDDGVPVATGTNIYYKNNFRNLGSWTASAVISGGYGTAVVLLSPGFSSPSSGGTPWTFEAGQTSGVTDVSLTWNCFPSGAIACPSYVASTPVLTAVPGPSSIQVSWTPAVPCEPEFPVTQYALQRCLTGPTGTYTTITPGSYTGTTWTHGSLSTGVTVWYRVVTNTAIGSFNPPTSAVISATTGKYVTPANVNATSVVSVTAILPPPPTDLFVFKGGSWQRA